MTPDELKALPKGEFVVMKTGTHPMRTRLRLFLEWGITFGEPYQTPERGQRKVGYAEYRELEQMVIGRYLGRPDFLQESVSQKNPVKRNNLRL